MQNDGFSSHVYMRHSHGAILSKTMQDGSLFLVTQDTLMMPPYPKQCRDASFSVNMNLQVHVYQKLWQ